MIPAGLIRRLWWETKVSLAVAVIVWLCGQAAPRRAYTGTGPRCLP